MGIRIERYSSNLKQEWDNFISTSKNGTFLFYRDFMEYHSDRFTDFSLLFYSKNKLVALLPSNKVEDIIYSHQGLTYGGLILSSTATTLVVLDIFESLILYLKEHLVSDFFYKSIPYIYHKLPSDEDLYALFRNNAKLVGRSISTCILQKNRIKYSELRKRGIRKSQYESFTIHESDLFSDFWKILEENLVTKYGVAPVHTVSEIQYLKNLYPNNIHLFEVLDEGVSVGGCVVFESEMVAHIQYISASEKGKKFGAIDYLFDHLIRNVYVAKPYLEFGISTEQNGVFLNEGLISQKEGFGGRGIVYDAYQLTIN